MKVVLVTNTRTPYRDPVYALLDQFEDNDVTVLYCAQYEPNRKLWDLESPSFKHVFLKENFNTKKGSGYVHNNTDVWKHLKEIKPDVVVTTGFNPTFLYAWLFTLLHRKKHITLFDDWLFTQASLTFLHKIVRKIVFTFSHAFVGPGIKTAQLYKSYGIKSDRIFFSHLCANRNVFTLNKSFEERNYDLMFSGRFHEDKLPFFFADVANGVKKHIPNLKVLVLGSGPEKDAFLKKLDNYGIDYDYPGFIQPNLLPNYYSDARLFLFTTRFDPWGVVGNEALASGTPVLTTNYAGVADDLVKQDVNGYVLDVDVQTWVDRAVALLQNQEKWQQLSHASLESLNEYNYENAAAGLKKACEYAYLH